jgi:hypothetical protein
MISAMGAWGGDYLRLGRRLTLLRLLRLLRLLPLSVALLLLISAFLLKTFLLLLLVLVRSDPCVSGELRLTFFLVLLDGLLSLLLALLVFFLRG